MYRSESFATFILKLLRKILRPFTNNLVGMFLKIGLEKVLFLGPFLPFYSWGQERSDSSNAYSLLISTGFVRVFDTTWQNLNKHNEKSSEQAFLQKLQFNFGDGYDVKFDLEVARCNYLPNLVLAYINFKKSNSLYAIHIAQQFNLLLDSLCVDTGYKGNQWLCTMDASIRVCNLILVLDLCESKAPELLTISQRKMMIKTVKKHLIYISLNSEYSFNESNNHYLTNILAICFALSFFKRNFAINFLFTMYKKRFVNEATRQYFPDGSNFEDSTGYHRYMSESIAYAIPAIFRQRRSNKIQKQQYAKICDLLNKAAEFSSIISQPDGTYPVIGDNDSGYLFDFYNDLHSDNENIVELCWDFIKNNDEQSLKLSLPLFYAKHFNVRWDSHEPYFKYVFERLNSKNEYNIVYNIPYRKCSSSEPLNSFICSSFSNKKAIYELPFYGRMKLYSYPDFGVSIYKSADVTVTFKYKTNSTGHSHSDILSITIHSSGFGWIIQDPGVFHYTKSWEERQTYRSACVHFSPIVESDGVIQEPVSHDNWFQSSGLDTVYNEIGLNCSAQYSLKLGGVMRELSVVGNNLIISDSVSGLLNLIKPSTYPLCNRYGEKSGKNSFDLSKIYPK